MQTKEITINVAKTLSLKGFLNIPDKAKTLVIFAHGSGSGRHSPRNQYVANVLNESGLGTLLLDLLTKEEEMLDELTREYRFNIPLLAERLEETCRWISNTPNLKHLTLSYFGSSTGAAAALSAAAKQGQAISAIVSRGGRPDLAKSLLPKVKAKTLFIVGGNDTGVIELNKEAFDQLTCEKELKIIPGATHLFEEPGKLEEVARLSALWFNNIKPMSSKKSS